ncbi:MAG: PilZ domain-containing protein [Myxococcus sp.]|nr:PilZ domain-containing protein [Myxococcus sp.]
MTSPNLRRFTRLTLEDTSVGVIDIESGVEFAGDGKDLSTDGLKFCAPMEPSIGADMQVVLSGRDARLPPLRASFHVLRVTPAMTGGWDVAGTLTGL